MIPNMYHYLDMQRLIAGSQHGFVHGKPYLTNLTEYFQEITKRIDEGSVVDVIYVNFNKTLMRSCMLCLCERLDCMESKGS